MERFDVSTDNNGFQFVYGKKKKKGDGGLMGDSFGESVSGKEGGSSSSSSGVKVKNGALAAGTTGNVKVPFHIQTIPTSFSAQLGFQNSMDREICSWIIEFLVRKSTDEMLVKKLIEASDSPSHEIVAGSFSEKILVNFQPSIWRYI